MMAPTFIRSDSGKQCSSDDGDETCLAKEDPSCPSRPHIIRCAAKYLDSNQNGKLDRVELETAIDSLPWFSRGMIIH